MREVPDPWRVEKLRVHSFFGCFTDIETLLQIPWHTGLDPMILRYPIHLWIRHLQYLLIDQQHVRGYLHIYGNQGDLSLDSLVNLGESESARKAIQANIRKLCTDLQHFKDK